MAASSGVTREAAQPMVPCQAATPVHAVAPRHRILIVTPWHPAPVDNGSKQRLRNVIDALSSDYEVVLASLVDCDVAGGVLPHVPGVAHQAEFTLPRYQPHSIGALAAGLRQMPRSLAATWDPQTARDLRRFAEANRPSLIIGADLRVIRYVCDLRPLAPTMLDEALVSPFLRSESSHIAGVPPVRSLMRERKYRRLLYRAAQQLDAIVVPSDAEADAFRALSGSSRVTVIENGVSHFAADSWTAPKSDTLLYTGSLTYAPNAEAVMYFLWEIMPLIRLEAPRAQLVVTGAVPDRLPAGAHDADLHLTGVLDTLDDLYRSARLFVAPILSGTGTRVKLLEAMAHGLPVATTSKGAEGLGVVAGQHVYIADSARDFAAATMSLLNDPARSEALGAAGKSFVQRYYDWAVIGARLRRQVARLIEHPAPVR